MQTVVLGAAGTGTSFAIASRLRAHWGDALRLIAIDVNPAHLVTTAQLVDDFVQVPYASDPAFAARIAELLLDTPAHTFIPILNEELALAARLLEDARFAAIDIWSSPLHARLTDKLAADAWLRALGVRTPAQPDWRHGADHQLYFVKPRAGIGSRGARVASAAELRAMPDPERAQLIIQERCAAPEVTVDSFYDAATGAAHAYCRERIETKAGVCTKARLFHDAELSAFAARIGQALGQRGTLCFQVMRGEAGWAVTDLNLRSGAGTAMTCAAGFDVLAAAYACRSGQDYAHLLPPLAPGRELYVTRQYAEFVMGPG